MGLRVGIFKQTYQIFIVKGDFLSFIWGWGEVDISLNSSFIWCKTHFYLDTESLMKICFKCRLKERSNFIIFRKLFFFLNEIAILKGKL